MKTIISGSYKSCRVFLTGLLMLNCMLASVISKGADVTLDLCNQARLQRNVISSVSSTTNSDDSTLIREYRIGFGATKISALSVGDQVTFRLFADKDITVRIDEETTALTGRSFIGKV